MASPAPDNIPPSIVAAADLPASSPIFSIEGFSSRLSTLGILNPPASITSAAGTANFSAKDVAPLPAI